MPKVLKCMFAYPTLNKNLWSLQKIFYQTWTNDLAYFAHASAPKDILSEDHRTRGGINKTS